MLQILSKTNLCARLCHLREHSDITQFWVKFDPLPSSVTLKCVFYLNLQTVCHKITYPHSLLIVWHHLRMLPKSYLGLDFFLCFSSWALHEPLVCMMKKVLFSWFLNFLIFFDHGNACASIVEIRNKDQSQSTILV